MPNRQSRPPRDVKDIITANDAYGRPISLQDALLTSVGIRMRGDGRPRWLEGRTNRPPRTAAEARNARRNLVNLLRRSGDQHGDLAKLADRLHACTNNNPCLSAACPICWRALQRFMVHASWHMFREVGHWEWTTLVGDDDRVPQVNGLDAIAIRAVEFRCISAADAKRVRAFGAVDISANEHEREDFQPYFGPHSHIITSAGSFDQRTEPLSGYPRVSNTTPKPIRTAGFDGDRRAPAYAFGWIGSRRISLPPCINEDGEKKRANTCHKPLLSKQRVQLAIALDRAGIDARVIMFGYELRTNGIEIWVEYVNRRRALKLLDVRRRNAAHRHAKWQAIERERERACVSRCLPTRLFGDDYGAEFRL